MLRIFGNLDITFLNLIAEYKEYLNLNITSLKLSLEDKEYVNWNKISQNLHPEYKEYVSWNITSLNLNVTAAIDLWSTTIMILPVLICLSIMSILIIMTV